jgi:hypothetical protein
MLLPTPILWEELCLFAPWDSGKLSWAMKNREYFISYAGSDGLEFARVLCAILGNDYKLWFYENHSELGESTWRDIAINLIKSDGLIVINTPDSIKSVGQKRECGIALNNNKPIYNLKHARADSLPELSWQNWFPFDESNFKDKFLELGVKLGWLFSKEEQLEESKKIEIPTPIKQRQDILSKLRRNINGLDPDKIQEYIGIIVKNYQTGSVAPYIARKVFCDDSSVLDINSYTRINLYHNIDKKEYLDPSYIWDYLFADVGRAIKRDEQKYIFQTILEKCEEPDNEFKRGTTDFKIIEDETERLSAIGYMPSVLLAPVDLMVPFMRFFHNNIDWSTGNEILKLENGINLELIWSNKYAPLGDFIITSPESGKWLVVPDLDTDNELAVALGNSIDEPDKKVAFFVGLMAKYELVHRRAISIIHTTS